MYKPIIYLQNLWQIVFVIGLVVLDAYAQNYEYYDYDTFNNPFSVDNKCKLKL